jgi:hypothetical protein
MAVRIADLPTVRDAIERAREIVDEREEQIKTNQQEGKILQLKEKMGEKGYKQWESIQRTLGTSTDSIEAKLILTRELNNLQSNGLKTEEKMYVIAHIERLLNKIKSQWKQRESEEFSKILEKKWSEIYLKSKGRE